MNERYEDGVSFPDYLEPYREILLEAGIDSLATLRSDLQLEMLKDYVLFLFEVGCFAGVECTGLGRGAKLTFDFTDLPREAVQPDAEVQAAVRAPEGAFMKHKRVWIMRVETRPPRRHGGIVSPDSRWSSVTIRRECAD